MLHSDAKSLVASGDRLFEQKRPLDSRNQDIADHFYPERADFTVTRGVGDDFADHLTTGYPSLVRRDLANSLGSMLRPAGQQWFHLKLDREDKADHEAKQWLEWAQGVQTRAMYDRMTMFNRATKEGDHDFATFGGCVISTEVNRRDQALLYRCWSLRDVAWAEDSYSQISEIHRNWKPTLRELVAHFPKTVHPKVRGRAEKDPHATINVRHIVLRSDDYGDKFKQPWTSVFIDCENRHILEERGSRTRIYTIPRWQTIAGSQYSFSPATMIALPDARLLQAMMFTLLTAGEKAVDPPMVGVAEAMRSDLDIRAGGFTAVDAEYDERLGEVLRPLATDSRGLPFGLELADRTSGLLREAFFLNTLSMPPQGGPEMTAFEVGQRVQEYIRNALPLFEPMEADYNGALCDITFETLLGEGAFGSPDTIPESLSEADVQFRFESPLAEMVEKQKGQKYLEAKALIAEAASIDPSATMIMDFRATLRDVLEGVQTPAKWLRSEAEVEAEMARQKQAADQQDMLASMEQGADIAQKLGDASQSLGATGAM